MGIVGHKPRNIVMLILQLKSGLGWWTQMQIDKQSIQELAAAVSEAVVNALEAKGLVGRQSANSKVEKTAYQRTEQLLYNYNNFKKIVAERMQEIEEIRKYGVPKKSGAVVQYGGNSGTVQGIVLPEESVEAAVRNVQASVEGTVQAIALIDKCMASLRSDPYYSILEMRYFEGRTQEDIALDFGVSQVTISNNKSRLVKELAMRLFPNQVMEEMLN